jgi:diguanylate cyclase (GGDEF)-like protein
MPDIKTLMLLYLITNVVNAGAIAIIWSQNRQLYDGIFFWVVTMALQAAGSVLHVLRGLAPDLISMTLANTIILVGVLTMLMGLERFTGKKGWQVHIYVNYVLLVVFTAVSAYFVVVQSNLLVRDIAVSAMLMIYTFQCCWLLLRKVDPGMRQITRLTGIVFAVYAAFNFVRIILNIVSQRQSQDFYTSGAVNALAITCYIVLNLCLTISLVLMVNKRLVMQVGGSENRFRELFDNMKSGVAVYEAVDGGNDFVFRDFNRAAENTEQLSKSDVVGRSVLQVFPAVKEFGLFEVFQSVWKDGIPRHHPVSQYKDGRIEGWRENYLYKLPSGEVVAIYDDVTESKKREEEIRILAVTEPLTGLYNRRGFMTLADQQIKAATRTNKKMSLLFIDLDGLKPINDTWGHEEGDRALVSAANVLKQTFRESDIMARIGGDEFAVLAVDATETPEIVIKRLTGQIALHNAQPNRRYEISMSIGTAVYDPQVPCSLDDLISRADTLMYEQKKTKSVHTLKTINPS